MIEMREELGRLGLSVHTEGEVQAARELVPRLLRLLTAMRIVEQAELDMRLVLPTHSSMVLLREHGCILQFEIRLLPS